MDSSDLSRDTSGTRAYTAFLVEMTTNDPAAVLPNISLLLSHLDGEVMAPHIKVTDELKKIEHKIVNIFLSISFNICFGCSKELSL